MSTATSHLTETASFGDCWPTGLGECNALELANHTATTVLKEYIRGCCGCFKELPHVLNISDICVKMGKKIGIILPKKYFLSIVKNNLIFELTQAIHRLKRQHCSRQTDISCEARLLTRLCVLRTTCLFPFGRFCLTWTHISDPPAGAHFYDACLVTRFTTTFLGLESEGSRYSSFCNLQMAYCGRFHVSSHALPWK